jgi:hypothetical protein
VICAVGWITLGALAALFIAIVVALGWEGWQ